MPPPLQNQHVEPVVVEDHRKRPVPTPPVPQLRVVGNQSAQRLAASRPVKAGKPTGPVAGSNLTVLHEAKAHRNKDVPPGSKEALTPRDAPVTKVPEQPAAEQTVEPTREPLSVMPEPVKPPPVTPMPVTPAVEPVDGTEHPAHEAGQGMARQQEGPAEADERGAVVGSGPVAQSPRPADKRLAPVAASYAAAINATAAANARQVRAKALTRRAHVIVYFGTRRMMVATVVGAAIGRVLGALAAVQQVLVGGLMARAQAVQSMIAAGIAQAMATGAAMGAAIRQGVAVVTGAISGVVSGVVGRIQGLAHGVPIPNLPIAGRVRNFVLQAVDRVAGAITQKVDSLLAFANRVVSFVVNGVLSLMAQVGAVLMRLVSTIVGAIGRIVALVMSRIARLAARIVSKLMAARRVVDVVLLTMQVAAIAQIDRAKVAALARIEANRQQGLRSLSAIIELATDDEGEHADPDDPLDSADDATGTAIREAAAAAAMALVARKVQLENSKVVALFEVRTANIVMLIAGQVLAYFAQIKAAIGQGIRQVIAAVGQAASRLIAMAAAMVSQVVARVASLVQRVKAVVEGLVDRVIEHVRGPVTRFMNFVGGLVERVRTFVSGLIDRAISVITGGSAPSADTASLTAPLAAYAPAQLIVATNAVMVLPALPAIFEGIMAIGAFLAGLELAVVLWWVALILIVLLIIGFIIWWLFFRTTAKPVPVVKPIPVVVPKPVVKPKPKEKDKDKPKNPKGPKKFWFWNPVLTYGKVVASGGIAGTLDSRARGPIMHLEGHHVWPEYVGGAKEQPLMSLRYSVHRVVHDGGTLHLAMGAAASSMGFTLTTTRAGNAAFIAHMRTTGSARNKFGIVLAGYYTGLNVFTDPMIPPPAYALGIAYAYARL